MPIDLVEKNWFDQQFEEAETATTDGRYVDAKCIYNTIVEKASESQRKIQEEDIELLDKARLYQPYLEMLKRAILKARDELVRVGKEEERANNFRRIKREISLAGLLRKININNKNLQNLLMKERRIEATECSFNILRRWNSYTPILCNTSGGGYLMTWKGLGVVVDPGIGFLRNALSTGYSIRDIDVIIMTHSHVDHTADFEGINTLIYEINERARTMEDQFGPLHKIRLMASVGAANKFFNMVSISYDNYLDVEVLRPHQEYKLSESLVLKTTPCNHTDLFCGHPQTCVGLKFGQPDIGPFLGITSDTGYWAGLSENFVDLRDRMMVLHIGSIMSKELSTLTRVTHPIYRNHLGLRGVFNLIWEVKPSSVLISEFGEEFLNIRMNIAEILDNCFPSTKIIPADIGLRIDLSGNPTSPRIVCGSCNNLVSVSEISAKTKDGSIQYSCQSCSTRTS